MIGAAQPRRFQRLAIGLVLLVLVGIPVALIDNPAPLNILVLTLMYVGLASAWNIGGGFSGYISFGAAAFFGLGTYALGLLVNSLGVGDYGPFLLVPVVGLITAGLAAPIGWVAFRTRQAAFVIVTLALMFIIQELATNLIGLTGGSQGLGFPVGPWGLEYDVPFYYAMLAMAALSIWISWLIRRSNFGLGLLAIRDDEDKAQAVGVPTGTYKLAAFVISAALLGMIGGIYGYFITYVYPQSVVDPLISAAVVLMSFLGGVGTVLGPVLGAILVEPSQLYLAYSLDPSLYLILYAAIFLVVVLILPRGIIPSLRDRLEARRGFRGTDDRTQHPSGAAAPPDEGTS
jgi:branched-chain amino acid transport system permease protein